MNDNPLGTRGFAFIEFASPKAGEVEGVLERFGFTVKGRHKSKNVILYGQGKVHCLVNNEPGSHADGFRKAHGPSVSAMGWLMEDAKLAYNGAVAKGATGYVENPSKSVDLPAIYGIGDSLIYFCDSSNWLSEFVIDPTWSEEGLAGLEYIDHLTHNLRFGNMNKWMDGFYAKIFNFRDIRYFDIEGEQTGLVSRAITSPCGKITIPLNESDDPKSQINEYIDRYNGEGIQHIAFHTKDICKTIDFMRKHGQDFLDVPDTYYDAVDERVMGFDEQLAELAKRGILIDGERDEKSYLLQLFTKDCLGPVFFEIISRKGHGGFGEGNFKALFEAIERDQIRRGYLPEKKHA
ncbi:MAG: 4-hydroxyphenylpyruvate dioxygenase [Proteobacteria bacterium]|nr:4-hydroxyphenylpyruvate dioxygenase [Pseudomonadota bacterium]